MEMDDETLRDSMPIILYSMDTFLHRIEGVSAFKEVKKNLEWAQYKNVENSVLGGLLYYPLADASSKYHAKNIL